MVNRRAASVAVAIGGWVLLATGCEQSSPHRGVADKVVASRQETAPASSLSAPLVTQAPQSPTLLAANSVGQTSPFVRATADSLQVKVNDYPIELLLDEIARQSGIVIVRDEALAISRVSLELLGLSLEEGLRQILKQQDLFFFFGPAKKIDRSIVEQAVPLLKGVWIFPQGKGDQIVPVPAAKLASSLEVEAGLRHADPKERARSVELLITRKGEQSLSDVRLALSDQDEHVRERTLRAALSSALPLPMAWLENLAQYDPSPTVRMLALAAATSGSAESVIGNPNIKMIAELALHDSNPTVQEQAREVLSQLDQFQKDESGSRSPLQPWEHSAAGDISASSSQSAEDAQQDNETP